MLSTNREKGLREILDPFVFEGINMNDEAISRISRYVEQHFPEPEEGMSSTDILKRTYSRWAGYEILHKLMDRPFDPPEVIIEDFILGMSALSYDKKDEKERIRCVIARIAAEDILDECL